MSRLVGLVLALFFTFVATRARATPCTFEDASSMPAMSAGDLAHADLAPKEQARVDAATLTAAIQATRHASLAIKNVVVTGDVVLDDTNLTGPLELENVVIDGKLSLRDVRARSVHLTKVRVRGATLVDGAKLERDFTASNAELCEGIHAARLSVAADFSLRDTRLCHDGPFDYDNDELEPKGPSFTLSRAQIAGDLQLLKVRATCRTTLRAVRVGASIVVSDSDLHVVGKPPSLDVGSTETQSGILISNSTLGEVQIGELKGGFTATDKTKFAEPLVIRALTSGSLVLAGIEAEARVAVFDANVSGLEVESSTFRGGVHLVSDKVAGLLYFGNIKAWGPWQLVGLSSGSLFSLRKTEFLCSENCTCDPSANDCPSNVLASLEAKGGVLLDHVSFSRATQFANLHDVSALNCEECNVDAPLVFEGIHLAGTFRLAKSQIRSPLSLVDVQASQLAFDEAGWSVAPGDVRFRSVQFKGLDLGKDDPSFRRVFDLLGHVAYASDVYESAAQYVQHEGRADVARDIRLASKRREIAGGPRTAGGVFRYVWKAFLYATIGGGVAPERAFYLLFALLVFGTLFYRDKAKMVWRGRADEPHYSAFWYTVDLLLPVMKLDEARDWSPRPNDRARIYASRVLRVVGFLMIPLLLAAATGLVR
jgi:hypothetical protein